MLTSANTRKREFDGSSEATHIAPDSNIADFIGNDPEPARYDSISLDLSESPQLIAKMIPHGSRVLDVGCGTGLIAGLLMRDRAAEVIGIEPDISRAAIARDRGISVEPDFLNEGLIERLGAFDIVVFADVLEHCAHPGDVLRLAIKFLKPKGQIIVSVPNVAHWTIRKSLLLGRFDYEPYGILDATHLRWFTRATLLRFLARAGLEIEEVRYSSGAMLPAYHCVRNFRYIRESTKMAIISQLAVRLPTLFACQFVVRSRVSKSTMISEI